ncbi:MAG: MarR family transcriptional regulator [Thermodesulfobacteriota bacterium]|nr:MarR family transcriptional regulator [Thermodesulfobacteriota bacterium]
MNHDHDSENSEITDYQVSQFQALLAKLFECCRDRHKYQSEKFSLPDAELRCLMLFGRERYLTPKGIAQQMGVAKSRVSRIVDHLEKRGLVQRIKDPEDSRFSLLSLTQDGQKKLDEIKKFIYTVHLEILLRVIPEQRKTLLASLDILSASLEEVKELMCQAG